MRVGFAQGNFIQHNYHWHDVLTHVRGAHVLKVVTRAGLETTWSPSRGRGHIQDSASITS